MAENPLSDRVDEQFRAVGLPLHDVNGMMRHILDCLGALKVRLSEELESKAMINVFGGAVSAIVNHITEEELIDSQSGMGLLVECFPDDMKRRDGRGWCYFAVILLAKLLMQYNAISHTHELLTIKLTLCYSSLPQQVGCRYTGQRRSMTPPPKTCSPSSKHGHSTASRDTCTWAVPAIKSPQMSPTKGYCPCTLL